MSKERVNKLYRPADLDAAIYAVQEAAPFKISWQEAGNIVKDLHKAGWKVVRVKDEL